MGIVLPALVALVVATTILYDTVIAQMKDDIAEKRGSAEQSAPHSRAEPSPADLNAYIGAGADIEAEATIDE